jgi:Fungal protein kinase
MVTCIALKWPIMQATFSDTTDLNKFIENRAIPHIKYQLRASSSQNLPHDPVIDKAQFQEKIMNIELGNRIYELDVPQVRNYMTIEGEQSTLPQRWWTAAAAVGKPLAASSPYGLKRKLDVALISMINGENLTLTGSDAWSKVNALCETSFTDIAGNMTIKETLQQKSYIMFTEQDDRSFNPTLFFSSSSFGFHVFDCTGLHCFVAQLNATSSPKCILHILGCLFFGRPATVGYDETIRSESGRAKEIYHDKKWWTVDKELHKSESFVG